jgi:hypothetical protein
MKTLLTLALLGALLPHESFGQGGAQADMVKRRAKETVNQNNVRQGVPPPAQLAPRPAPPAQPGATPSAVTQAASFGKLTADIAGFKPNATATAEQKQQFTIDLAQSARGRKPSLGTVKQFVDSISAVLPQATLTSEQQARLAQNLDGVFNAKSFSALQLDKTIEDVQAILEVGTVKRTTAISVAADLKAVGSEIRR